ncbi:GNAT family N-acetyltransferase [Kitasatospora sp. NPDC057015]|uniref:GNAT family N-acetyltransferase n=1 Tax=Kitasatospora sp. NPDC057015 TaxID=3346001 RepID=UPI0036371122
MTLEAMTDDELPSRLLAAYDDQMRGFSPGPDAVLDHDGTLARLTGGHRGFVSTPRDVGVRGADLDDLIARQTAHFAAHGQAFEWKTRGHDSPADLPDRLLAAGFVRQPRETVLVGPAADLDLDAAPPAGVTVRRTADPADLPRIVAMESAVWGQDMGFLADHLLGLLTARPEKTALLVAEAGGEIVSAAWLMLDGDREFAGLRGGSTLEAWRGRGVYRALVAGRARIALEYGHRYLHVDASADSAPILQRLGLTAITTITRYVWTPPA